MMHCPKYVDFSPFLIQYSTITFIIFLCMVISNCSISIVIVLYLIKKKLKSTYRGQCIIVYALHLNLSHIAYIAIYIVKYLYLEYFSWDFYKILPILIIVYRSLQLSSHFMIIFLSYQTYSAVTRYLLI